MTLHNALKTLRQDRRFVPHIVSWHTLPPRPARFGPWPRALAVPLRKALAHRGIHALYTHQSRAIAHHLDGDDVVLVTPTATGKSLAYHLPALHHLLTDPEARALLLFPTKALAQDQYHTLRHWLDALTLPTDWVGVYDGDTPREERSRVRARARILITNPDMLHRGILPHHTRWADLLRGLRLIVLDEVHTYRGIFGGHVANLLRRLARVVTFYQRPAGQPLPRYICTSATIGNPRELVVRLTGRDPALIDENGAPQPQRTLIFYNPPLLDPVTGLRRSSLLEAQRLARHFLAHDVQTVLFARARQTVEVLLTYVRAEAPNAGIAPEQVRGYRGGYLPRARREIERGLRAGTVRAVVATNALELGVDIGTLGAALLVGYPGTIAGTWQQIGRAGRRDEGGVGILIAGAGALDQYIVHHPEFLLRTSPEHALIAADNLHVLVDHIRCALFELPMTPEEPFGTFEHTADVLAFLEEEGEARHAGTRYHWIGEGYPAETVSLRLAAAQRVVIQERDNGNVRTIGEVDWESAPRLVHPEAVYLHEGTSYLVREVDWDASIAYVEARNLDYYTQPISREELTVLAEEISTPAHGTTRSRGDVLVRTQVVGYRKVRWHTHETLGYGEVDVPPRELETVAYWITFLPETLERLREQGLWRTDAVVDYGPNWARQRARALARDGHRCQRCGAKATPDRPLHVHHIRPFRTFGYIPGVNDAYKEANRLDNLITLCARCHRLAETTARLRSGFNGAAYVIAALAPLFVMADPGDIGRVVEARSPHTRLPTITLYDAVPGGIGLAERLYDAHEDLLRAALERVRGCGCEHGCPACVGPVLVAEEGDVDTKQLTEALLVEALRAP